MPSPKFSVLIVNWNGMAVLPRCLEALAQQVCRDFEIILFDNGSKDHSLEFVAEKYPQVKVLTSHRNIGFAAANNLAAAQAQGEWLALLNNDAFPDRFWLDILDEAARTYPDTAMFASRLLMADYPDRIDGTGDAVHACGAVWNRQHRHPANQADKTVRESFAPQGAAALVRRSAFEAAGGFDEDFFSYHEDVDLAFRLRLLGHHCLYIPDALVYHKGSHTTGKGSNFAVVFGHRNWVWCWVQNMPGPLLWRYLPEHLLANLFFILFISFKGQPWAIFKAKWHALLGLPNALRKRRVRQSARTATVRQIHQALERGFFEPYVQGFRARRALKTLSKPGAG
ncbi:MAG TPA: glycosyltransferase family 2 protein [Anaerolineales bacterium]|nr:glycosyltransferase family 2 protein [Anaerolineales bacterium]